MKNLVEENHFVTLSRKFWESIHDKSDSEIKYDETYIASDRHISFENKYYEKFFVIPQSLFYELSGMFRTVGKSIFVKKKEIEGYFSDKEKVEIEETNVKTEELQTDKTDKAEEKNDVHSDKNENDFSKILLALREEEKKHEKLKKEYKKIKLQEKSMQTALFARGNPIL